MAESLKVASIDWKKRADAEAEAYEQLKRHVFDALFPLKDGGLCAYAERELRRARLLDEDSDYGGMLGQAVLDLIRVFSWQGHSGFSASMCLDIFNKVASFLPLTPLTGEDEEWEEVSEGLWQNKRCSRVFKRADGVAFDIEAKVFCGSDGVCYTSNDSKVEVKFPYVPKTEYLTSSPRLRSGAPVRENE